jgi:hypothetical protein
VPGGNPISEQVLLSISKLEGQQEKAILDEVRNAELLRVKLRESQQRNAEREGELAEKLNKMQSYFEREREELVHGKAEMERDLNKKIQNLESLTGGNLKKDE